MGSWKHDLAVWNSVEKRFRESGLPLTSPKSRCGESSGPPRSMAKRGCVIQGFKMRPEQLKPHLTSVEYPCVPS